MSEAPLLKVEHLKKYFEIRRGMFSRLKGHVRAIDDVSFSLRKGEVLGLAGESGSGKTTIGRALLRLVEPTSGSIQFSGEEVTSFDRVRLRGFRKSAQFVFQDPHAAINPTMTIGEAIAEPLRVQRIAYGTEVRDRVEKLLTDVSLPVEYFHRKPQALSGGQLQRVIIARALAVDPKLVIADEPVASLDVSIQAQIVTLLQELRKRHGLAMIFISHDLAVMEYISDRIAVVYLGKLMEIGPARAVTSSPQHPYTEALVSAIPDGDGARKRIILKGDAPSPVSPPSGCVFRTRCAYAISQCSVEVPPMREVSQGHWKACIRDDVL